MKRTRHVLLRTPTAVGLALIVLLILANLLVSEWNVLRLSDDAHRVIRKHTVLTMLEEVLSHVTAAETGERGFLITGDPVYLESYEAAEGRAQETLHSLAGLTAERLQWESEVIALRQRVEARFDELRRAIEAYRRGGFPDARASVASNHGRRLMNEMRRLVSRMQSDEHEALEAQLEESHRSARISELSDFGGAMLGICMVGLAYVLYHRELAHRRRADDATRRLAAIVESSDDAIISESLDGLIVSWNGGARQIYGYSAAEAIGRPVSDLCPPERFHEVQENLDRVWQGIHLDHFETTRLRKDGRRIDVSLTISPVKDDQGRVIGASAICRDISDQRLLQREVLEIASREQRRIGQDLHDHTGQELTGLAMMAQRLCNDLSAAGLPQAAIAERLVDGLEQVLSHARALSKGLFPVELEAEGLMVALVELASRTSELHAVDCTFHCREPVQIRDNEAATHLYRMTQEAVTNAVKHGQARHIVIGLELHDGQVKLTVSDDGNGFPEMISDSSGIGLRIMRYRADLIGAILAIEPVQPHRTLLTCILGSPAVAPAVLVFEAREQVLHGASL